MKAAAKGDYEQVVKLIESGHDVNAESSLKSTAVMFAAQEGKLEIVKKLVQHGAKLGHTNKLNWNIFIYTANSGNLDLMKWLVEETGLLPKQNQDDINKALLLTSLSEDNVDMLNYIFKHFGMLAGNNQQIKSMSKNDYIYVPPPKFYTINCARNAWLVEREEMSKNTLSVLQNNDSGKIEINASEKKSIDYLTDVNNNNETESTYKCTNSFTIDQESFQGKKEIYIHEIIFDKENQQVSIIADYYPGKDNSYEEKYDLKELAFIEIVTELLSGRLSINEGINKACSLKNGFRSGDNSVTFVADKCLLLHNLRYIPFSDTKTKMIDDRSQAFLEKVITEMEKVNSNISKPTGLQEFSHFSKKLEKSKTTQNKTYHQQFGIRN